MADEAPLAAPPETVPPAPPEPRANYRVNKPLISGDRVVQPGYIVSLTQKRADEWADLIEPATDQQLRLYSTFQIIALD